MAQAQKEIEDYIGSVKSVLQDTGSSETEISVILREMRDHIDEAMSEPDADPAQLLTELDPPESYGESIRPDDNNEPDRLGHIGFFGGLFFLICGFVIAPNIASGSFEKMAPPVVVMGLILSLTLGVAGRKGKFGLASLLLFLAILALITLIGIAGG